MWAMSNTVSRKRALSPVEIEILRAGARGQAYNKALREQFNMAESTAKYHRAEIVRIMRARTFTQAVALAWHYGIIDDGDITDRS